MSEIVCSRCSHPNSEAANYCSSCGFDLHRPVEESTAETVIDFSQLEAPESPGVGSFVIKRGGLAGSRFDLAGDLTSIGRHPESTIFLDDVTVSRRHADVRREGDGFVIADVGSLNGTYLNRERIELAKLRSGDEVQIGKFKLVYLVAEA